jgi:release factor glutamine methyltransferase
MTVTEALREGERRLREAGVTDARLDAELLLRHVSGWDRAQLLVNEPAPLDAGLAQRFLDLVAARASRRPLQHLTGRQAFWHHDFLVSPAVLIPRPETEILVEATLARLAGIAAPVVADVGTGSGCIAVSTAAERSDAQVIATDLSPDALAVARNNAAQIGVADRVSFRQGDLLAPAADRRGSLHAVLSNPPYIGLSERDSLAPEVRDHEPATALFAPVEPYSIYRRLAPMAHEYLAVDGWLIVEVGMGMADEVARICAAAGFAIDAILPDLQGIPRVVVGRKTRPGPEFRVLHCQYEARTNQDDELLPR